MSDARVEALAQRVRDARTAGAPMRIVGRGGWLDAGAPTASGQPLETAALDGILEYEPGDLTMTARAGTRLADVQAAAAAHGQWLPLDPAGGDAGSLGATIATASWGPLAAAFGTPRDQVLGCEVVTGTGVVVRAGGRVVKNVAGFDLTRLMTGAWGTLGVITEATVRLRARPETEASVAIALPNSAELAHAWRWLRTSEFTPMAAELLSPSLARQVGADVGGGSVLLLRAGGNEPLVRALLRSASMLGTLAPAGDDAWARLSRADATLATFRVSVAPARVAALWEVLAPRADAVGGAAHANLQRGTVRCIVPHAAVGPLLGGLAASRATVVGERGPAPLWAGGRPDAVLERLAAGVRRAFDPDGVLNPGILGALSAAPAVADASTHMAARAAQR